MIPRVTRCPRIPLDRAYVASRLGLDPHVLSGRLHKMKKATGIKGASVWVPMMEKFTTPPTGRV